MVDEKALISQCVDLANQIIKNNAKAVFSIKLGEGYTFSFDNHQDYGRQPPKKKSPSNENRDLERTLKFKNKNAKDAKDEIDIKASEPKPKKEDVKDETNNFQKETLNDSPRMNHGLGEKETDQVSKQNKPCESCTKDYNLKKDISNSMCDECIVVIAAEENTILPNKYECEICKNRFKTKTQFKEHKNCYFKNLTFVCEVCKKLWRNEDEFEYHMELKHNNHDCVRCAAQFDGKDNLDAHYKAKHRAF